MMIINTKNKIRTTLMICFSALAIAGCASFSDFKKLGSQFTPTQQVTQSKVVKTATPAKKKVVVRKISSDCSYIIRDLSIHNAKDVWCIPRALQ